jgi:hypothetical protein
MNDETVGEWSPSLGTVKAANRFKSTVWLGVLGESCTLPNPAGVAIERSMLQYIDAAY